MIEKLTLFLVFVSIGVEKHLSVVVNVAGEFQLWGFEVGISGWFKFHVP